MNWKKIFSFLFCIVLCGAPVVWLYCTGRLKMLWSIPVSTVAICFLITIAATLCCGYAYFISLRFLGCKLEKKDILFYPYMQSLFGLIIPVQGTSLFAVCYLKMRYGFQMTQSIVMILFLYLLNFIFGGLAGITYSLFCGKGNSLLFYGSVCCFLVPFFVFILLLILKKCGRLPFIPERIFKILQDSMNSMNQLLTCFSLLLQLVGINIARQCVMALAYVLICRKLGGQPDFLWGYLIIVAQEIAVILRLTPGNLGLTEMIAGFISQITGVAVANGVICSLIMSLLYLLLTLSFGISGIWMQMRGTSFPSLRDIVQKIKRSDT